MILHSSHIVLAPVPPLREVNLVGELDSIDEGLGGGDEDVDDDDDDDGDS